MKKRARVKPSKSSSIMGAVVGVVFVFIGLFVAIPQAGAFGILWTIVAIGITGTHIYNAVSDEGISSYEIVIDDNNTSQIKHKLEELQSLYDAKLISSEEYNKKRQDIIDKM